jgi:hypothetical protein
MSLSPVKSTLRFLRRDSRPAPVETVVAAETPEPALRVVLLIGQMPARPLAVEVRQRLVRGLGAGDDGEAADVDLTAFGAERHGVSRRHAALVHQNGALMVEDLNSAGGTRLNGLPLSRGARFRLRNNDELELGSLYITVRAMPVAR